LPAFGTHGPAFEPEIGDDRGLIHVDRDLLSAALSGEMLSTGERHASTLLRSAQQVNRYERDRSAGAFLPWRISS
jgi:hypothetical protein